MATLELEPAVGGDDGFTWNNTTFSNTDNRIIAGGIASARDYDCFIRFPGVSGLSGATINSCDLIVMPDSPGGGTALTTIGFRLSEAAPAAPTSAAEHVTDQGDISTEVTWDEELVNNVQATSPDLSTALQDVADTLDPSALLLLHDDDGSSDGDYMRYGSYEAADSADIPHLSIDYTAGGGGGLSIPIAMHHYKQMMGAN